jgi:hypothetical protein
MAFPRLGATQLGSGPQNASWGFPGGKAPFIARQGVPTDEVEVAYPERVAPKGKTTTLAKAHFAILSNSAEFGE